MGLGMCFRSYSSYDRFKENTVYVDRPVPFPNPDPTNYVIKRSIKEGDYLLVDISYPDCTNYEGRKFLLYKGICLFELEMQKTIDPHFSDNKDFHSPIARFEPTERGWKMALDIMKG